jgi:hypothetical protein
MKIRIVILDWLHTERQTDTAKLIGTFLHSEHTQKGRYYKLFLGLFVFVLVWSELVGIPE